MYIKNNGHNYWYRQQVLDRLHESYHDGNSSIYSISLQKFVTNHELDLITSSIKFFGSWSDTIRKAGFGQEIQTKLNEFDRYYWSGQKALNQISTLYNAGFDLSARFIRHVYPNLYYSSMNKLNKHSWSGVLSEAQVDYKDHGLKRRNFWSIYSIYLVVKDYENTYGNLQPGFMRRANPGLYSSSHRYFKSWLELLKEFKIDRQKNLVKIAIEPLRTSIIMEYLKKMFELSSTEYTTKSIKNNQNTTPNSPKSIMEIKSGRKPICITSSYRSWDFDLENELVGLLGKYPNVICYYSIGEPRQWFNDDVKFINLNRHYQELSQLGRDDIISAIGKLSRGDVPDEYRVQFSDAIRNIKENLKRTE